MLQSKSFKAIVIQLLILVVFLGGVWFILHTAGHNLDRLGVAQSGRGFKFLTHKTQFSINFSPISYSEDSTYLRLFIVGILNTLMVSALGIFFATILGFIVGILKIGGNKALRIISHSYVELMRNIPLLIQILFWYFMALNILPSPKNSLSFAGSFFLNNRGLSIPFPELSTHGLQLSLPAWQGFNFVGGVTIIPEFVALLFALSTYTAAFIAEIVRAGIQGVSHGQVEAARALGFSRFQVLRFVVIPQGFRIMIPPLTSQYLNLTKNSSLAMAIGYPDLFAVFAGTALNQSGQAIEIIAMTMGVYLVMSLMTSLFMNWFNLRYAL